MPNPLTDYSSASRIGVAQADYILTVSDRPEGMVKTWRNECLKHRASHGMLRKLEERYLLLGGQVHLQTWACANDWSVV